MGHIQHEAAEQKALFQWAEYQHGTYPELEAMYHIPNGGSRNCLEAANLKRQGVKAGVPDIHLPVARSGYSSLYIELKFGRNKPSENQHMWITLLKSYGNAVEVCYSWEAAAEIIKKYLKGEYKA